MKFGDWAEDLFETHKFVRRVIVIWAMVIISLLVWKYISLMTVIDTATVSGVTVIIGILSTVLAFYIRNRELDQQREIKKET